jgi:amylosucrase
MVTHKMTRPHVQATDIARRAGDIDALRGLMARLYGGTPQFDSWFAALIDTIQALAAARSPSLQALDRRRGADPDWFLGPGIVGYSAYVDRFAGNLAGVRGRIDYLRGLGVRYLHLLPFWRARAGENDGGFAVSDYMSVEPGLGDVADLPGLTEALREAEISLCVDMVLNHAADDHPWAVAARAGDPRYRAYFHILGDRAQVDAYEAGLTQVFPDTAPGNFTYVAELEGWVWTTFHPYQWDLNWANREVFAEFVRILLGLANRGVEGFRLDSAAYLWKRLGGPCRNEPQTHLILQALRLVMRLAAPAVLLKAEVIAPVGETVQFLGAESAPECHLAYHSGLMTAAWAALAEGQASMVSDLLAAVPPAPAGAGWITYVRCHDDIGWMALAPQAGSNPREVQARLKAIADHFAADGGGFARGETFQTGPGGGVHGLNGATASLAGLESAANAEDEARAIDRIALLHGLAFAAGGLPVIYMGDEIGQTNDYAYRADPERAREGRWLQRPMFDEEAAARSGNSATRPGKVRARLGGLIAARRELPPLTPRTAPRPADLGDPAVLGFWRGGSTLLLFNLSSEPRRVGLAGEAGGDWRDLLSGQHARDRLDLPGLGMAWLSRAST